MSFLSSVSLTTASTVRVPVETAMRSRCEFVKSGSDGRDRAFPADRGSRFEPREAKREPRPCRRRVDAAATPVRLSDRVDDREPEADATMRARSRGVRARETLENLRQRIARDAAPAVIDFDHQRLARGGRTKLDPITILRVLHRVFEQRVEHRP